MRRNSLLSSTVITKVIIALTGLVLVAYLCIHLAGNLLVFAGPEMFNTYSHQLTKGRFLGPLIIAIELGLLAIFLLHGYKAASMTYANYKARPVKYAKKKLAGFPSRKSAASSTMIWTGLFTIVFVVIHLFDIKYGVHYTVPTSEVRDLYRLEMEIFSTWWRAAFYIVSMIVIGFHLWHGSWSATQSLGVDHPNQSWKLLRASKWLAVIICGGFSIIVLWAMFIGAPAYLRGVR